MDHVCTNNETKRHEPEHRDAFLNQTERALPHHKPDDERSRNSPPDKFDSRGELECDTDTANLRRQDQQAHKRQDDVEKRKVVEAKAFANRIGYRTPTNSREPAGLFDEKNDAETTEHDRPDQLK